MSGKRSRAEEFEFEFEFEEEEEEGASLRLPPTATSAVVVADKPSPPSSPLPPHTGRRPRSMARSSEDPRMTPAKQKRESSVILSESRRLVCRPVACDVHFDVQCVICNVQCELDCFSLVLIFDFQII